MDDQPAHDKLDEPVCEACSMGMEHVHEWEKDMMEKHGWYVHFVQDETYPLGVNIHTHGIQESFKHADLQGVLPLPLKTANAIMADVVNQIKEGQSFKDGQVAFGIIDNDYPVKFISAEECNRPVLRIVFPDAAGCLEKDEMDEQYALQYKTE